MQKVYIAAARRSAIGSFLGALAQTTVADIGAPVVRAILNDTGIPAARLDEVLVGNVLPAGEGQGVARQIAIHAGIPAAVPASGVNMVCGSGMKSIMNAAAYVKSGMGSLYIAGGAENMSLAPYLLQGARQGLRMGNKDLQDHMLADALTDAFEGYHMGVTAENVAEKYGITREAQDAFAMTSQEKAIRAVNGGEFADEIVPITVKRNKAEVSFDTDEYPNRSTSLEKLGALRPAFQKTGTVTAGNASGINDGAAFLLLASAAAVSEFGLTPLAEVVAVGQGGVDPSIMGMGPVPAIRAALKSANLSLADMDILELNEAFAAQALGVITELAAEHGVDKDAILAKANLNGGAIALGHPVGASGARITVTLTHLLRKKQARYGLASLCIGGGMGTAVVLRRV
ncbi:MAG: acetyl-CoA C-acetyltransferase [Oscillospiraceae bacterium]|nr:acetyl-CoA C-acetyltransferase [Oscillospiraceae bacterium]